MIRKIMAAGIALTLSAGLITACLSPGAPRKAKESWLPDERGNLQLTNTSGKNVAVFINDNYARSLERGKAAFTLDVLDARNPIGTEIDVKIYDRETLGSLNSPAETALMNTFSAALFPPEDQDRLTRIAIPLPTYRDKEGAAAGGRDVLVKFEYPLEDIALGTVTATVFEGQITSRRPFVVMSPQVKPLLVPMEVGFKQISVMYTVATNNKKTMFYSPNWEEAAVNMSIRAFNTADLNPTYTIKPVDQVAVVTWMYPQDNLGSLIIRNKSSRPVQVDAASLEPGGNRGMLEQIAVGARPGSSALEIGPLATEFQLRPGRYQLSAKQALRNTLVAALDNLVVDAGTRYYWIITDSGRALEKDTSLNAATDLNKVIQNWKIRSNIPGAAVSFAVESMDASVKGEAPQVIGNTDAAGELVGSLAAANLVQNLTYENAAKVVIKITVAKDGYVSVTQAINALTLIEAGNDFVPARFDLPEAANKNTPGAEYKLEFKEFTSPYYGN